MKTDSELTAEVKRLQKLGDKRFEGLGFPWPVLIFPAIGLFLGIYFGATL